MRFFTQANCRFYLRESVQGGYRYTSLGTSLETGTLPTAQPPLVGDLVSLDGDDFRVIDRHWLYPAYGSMAWPAGGRELEPLSLTVMVERATGMFADEVPDVSAG